MRRATFAVLVIPYAVDAFAEVAYALCRARGDEDEWWHAPAGHGARGETPVVAARRLGAMLAGVPDDAPYRGLDSRALIEADGCAGACGLAEYAFAVRVDPAGLPAPAGHERLWASYEVADGLLRREAERNALWELARRLGLRQACR